jgi:hypothetical protein
VADRYPLWSVEFADYEHPVDLPRASTRVMSADVLQAAAVSRTAISHWIEHQTRLHHQEIRTQAACRSVQVRAGQHVRMRGTATHWVCASRGHRVW